MNSTDGKEKVKAAKNKEKKEVRFLIRDFYELRHLLDIVLKVEENINFVEVEQEIKNIRKKLRGGILSGEERVERRMARNYARMKKLIEEAEVYLKNLKPVAVKKIGKLLEQAEVYNADLERLGSRGGEIEKVLAGDETPEIKLKKVVDEIKKAIKDVQAFKQIMDELIQETHFPSINVTKFIGTADYEVENMYFLNIKIEGTIDGDKFTLGRGEEDIRATNTNPFRNVDKLIETIIDLENFDGSGFFAKYGDEIKEQFLPMIFEVVKMHYGTKLEEFLRQANSVNKIAEDHQRHAYEG